MTNGERARRSIWLGPELGSAEVAAIHRVIPNIHPVPSDVNAIDFIVAFAEEERHAVQVCNQGVSRLRARCRFKHAPDSKSVS